MSTAESCLQRGADLFARGELSAAAAAFAAATELAPAVWQAHYNLGMCHDRLGQGEAALAAYQEAHRLAPTEIACITNLAACAFNLGQYEQALQLALRHVQLEPLNPLAYDNLGQIFQRLGQYDSAAQSFRNALMLAPEHPAIHNNLGLLLQSQDQTEEARQSFLKALELAPGHVDAITNLGALHLAQGEVEAALERYRQALVLTPDSAAAWTNLGNAQKAAGRYAEALAAHQKAVALAPQYALAHWNLALTLLAAGQLQAGWSEYEWGPAVGTRTRFANRLPRWQGEALGKRHLLLRAEQGLGDTLQFCRFIPQLQKLAPHITLECPASLVPLLRQLPGLATVVPQGPDLPEDAWGCDCYLPLMSLPHVLHAGLEDLPGTMPYLKAPAERLPWWQQQLGRRRGLRVGLAWAGNPAHPNDRWRSCPPADMAVLGEIRGVEFISLQLPPSAPPLPLRNLAADIGDFADTAAIVAELDLVISVDTAIIHLAGALGRPAWLLLAADADWRWLRERQDSPWYPSLRLYRQKMPGQWLPVLEAVAKDLSNLAGGVITPRA